MNTMTLTYRTASDINSAMGRVYGHMTLAVIMSMMVSWSVAAVPALVEFFFTGVIRWVVIFAPMVMALALGMTWQKFSYTGLQILLHSFAAVMGLSMAMIFTVYSLGSIVSAFMAAAVLFAVMSFWGYFTKKDLSGFGSLLMVGLIAVVIASVINIFVGHGLFQMVISGMAILVFLGLTAYDTQNIRQIISQESDGRAEIMGAVSLYLNLVNIFMSLLQLFGQKDE